MILDPDYVEGTYALPAGALRLTVASGANLGSGLSTTDPVWLRSADGLAVDGFGHPFNPGNGVSVEKSDLDGGDTPGNWVASPCGRSPGAVNCASLPPAAPLPIRITEVLANPLDERTGELVELYNAGDAPVDATLLTLSDGDSSDALVGWAGGSAQIPPGAYAVVLDPDYAGQYAIAEGAVWLTIASTVRIGDGLATSDPLVLSDATGPVDTFSHPFDPGNGVSVERLAPSAPDVAASWNASGCPAGVSPGAGPCAATPPAEPVHVVITEVLANPLDEDTGEWVELFNAGDAPVDLAGYRLSDGDAEDVLFPFDADGSAVLEPGAFALVLDAEYAGQYALPAGTVRLRTGDTTLGSGLATTDPVRLYPPVGTSPVSTFSFPFNPGNGKAVERVSPDAPDVAASWVTSPCLAALGAAHDYMSPGAPGCTASPTAPPAEEEPPPAEEEPPPGTLAGCGVVVTEIMYDPKAVSDTAGEWVELTNKSGVDLDLDGWAIRDFGSNLHVISGSVPFPVGARVVLCANADPAANGGVPCDYQFSGFYLGNAGDSVVIETPSGAIADQVTYATTAPWPAHTAGVAIQLADPCSDNDSPGAWLPAEGVYGAGDLGSPGAPNTVPTLVTVDPSVPDWQTTAPDASGHFAPDDELERHLLDLLGSAQTEIRVAVYNIRLAAVADTLIARAAAGVDVAVLMDAEVANAPDNTVDDVLVAAGIPVTRVDNTQSNWAAMHAKWAVIDGHTVVTGSANWTWTALNQNDEVLLTVRDPALAARYRAEWDEIRAGTAVPSAPFAADAPVQPWMGPEDALASKVTATLDGATERVLVAMFELTHPMIVDALVAARGRGLPVVVVLGAHAPDAAVVDTLQAAGVTVILADNTSSPFADMHLKMAVVDARTLLLGSFNWTLTGADDSDENLVVIDHPHLAARAEGRLVRLLHTYGPVDAAALGLPSAPVAVILRANNVPGAPLRVASTAGGVLSPPVAVPAGGLHLSLPPGTHLSYRYQVVGPEGHVVGEGGPRHTFTVPWAPGPHALEDVFRP